MPVRSTELRITCKHLIVGSGPIPFSCHLVAWLHGEASWVVRRGCVAPGTPQPIVKYVTYKMDDMNSKALSAFTNGRVHNLEFLNYVCKQKYEFDRTTVSIPRIIIPSYV